MKPRMFREELRPEDGYLNGGSNGHSNGNGNGLGSGLFFEETEDDVSLEINGSFYKI